MKVKKIIIRVSILGLLFLLITGFSNNKEKYAIKNTTFGVGEEIKFRLHYGLFTGAYPVMKTFKETVKVNGQECYKTEISGKTVGVINKLFRVKDSWRSYMDTTTLIPPYAYRNISEGDYRLKEYTYLNRGTGKIRVVRDKKGKKATKYYEVEEGVHDIVSGFYYFRNIDYSKKNKGDKVTVKAFFENELYTINVVYKGTEKIKTKLGKIEAYKLVPEVPDNDLFDGEESISFWISADKNRIPLKIKANMTVGAVELDIHSHKNLRYNIDFD